MYGKQGKIILYIQIYNSVKKEVPKYLRWDRSFKSLQSTPKFHCTLYTTPLKVSNHSLINQPLVTIKPPVGTLSKNFLCTNPIYLGKRK